jgi:Domain of unknown function (DUF4157)
MGTQERTQPSNNKSVESREVCDHRKKNEGPVARLDYAQAWITQGAGRASPQDHLAKLSSSQSSHSSLRSQYVLQLQRRYGNRYVQHVLGAPLETEQEDEVSPEVEDVIQRSRAGGSALDAKTRLQMESAFRADFGNVRVHTSARADALNQALNARAFTTGQDVFFREGEYRPGSSSGRELLAHELTHVVQQDAGTHPEPAIHLTSEEAEQEAEPLAAPATVKLSPPPIAVSKVECNPAVLRKS